MKRIYVYIKLSKGETEDSSKFLESVERYKSIIASHADWSFGGAFGDDGTIHPQKRFGLSRILGECCAGNVDAILLKNSTHITRDTEYLLATLKMLKDKGVELLEEDRNFAPLTFTQEDHLFPYTNNCQNEACKKEEERLEKAKKELVKFLDYLDDEVSERTTDDINRLYEENVEIKMAGKAIQLPMTDVVYQAIYDAMVKMEDEM